MTDNLMDKEHLVRLVTQITVEVLKEFEKKNKALPSSSKETPVLCGLAPPDCDACGHCTAKKPDLIDKFVQSGATRFSSSPETPLVSARIAGMIDHTLLKPDVSPEELQKICDEARQYNFKSVCVNPNNVAFCVRELQGTSVGVTAVVGFPLGATTSRVKAFETDEAIANGATEIDMVINVTSLKAKNYAFILEDIQQVVRAAKNKVVKVILETGLLNQTEKIAGCVLSKAAGAHFVKTSTGFGKGGATIEDIQLMREVVGAEMGVKASGGIRDTETAQKMVQAGATRIGASASVGIVRGERAEGKGY